MLGLSPKAGSLVGPLQSPPLEASTKMQQAHIASAGTTPTASMAAALQALQSLNSALPRQSYTFVPPEMQAAN